MTGVNENYVFIFLQLLFKIENNSIVYCAQNITTKNLLCAKIIVKTEHNIFRKLLKKKVSKCLFPAHEM